ncbi:MAG: hypothetical protein WAV46_03250 [Candidatus Moraniibacteriota bacterium]
MSLFVLTVGLMTVLALISSSLRQSYETRDTIIAVELAQEGVELVRNVRDNGFISDPTDPFKRFLSQKHCRIDYTVDSNADLNCRGSVDTLDYLLQYKDGFYQYDATGTGSRFSRYVYIDYSNANQTAIVRSFVYWGRGASGMFVLGDAGSTGDTAYCTVAKKCVFTEILLTRWKG